MVGNICERQVVGCLKTCIRTLLTVSRACFDQGTTEHKADAAAVLWTVSKSKDHIQFVMGLWLDGLETDLLFFSASSTLIKAGVSTSGSGYSEEWDVLIVAWI